MVAESGDWSLQQIEQFLFEEAALLDERRFTEWLALWVRDASYTVTIPDRGNPRARTRLIAENHLLLRTRVKQLVDGNVLAESPPWHTCRIVSNVRRLPPPADGPSDGCRVVSTLVVHRSLGERRDQFFGHCTFQLVNAGGEIRLREKDVALADSTVVPGSLGAPL